MNVPIAFRRVNNEIAALHFVYESEELAGIIRNCPRFLSRVCGSDSGFKSLAIRLQFSEIANLCPPNGDNVVLKEKRIGIASRTTMYIPQIVVSDIC